MQQALYDRYAPKMYGVCLRYAKNNFDADDILQNGFVKVFQNLHKFRKEGSFEGWIRRIVINTCIEFYRKKVKRYDITEVHENTIEDHDLNVLDTMAENDLLEIINGIAQGYKTIFNLYVVDGYSHKEIAEKLGISEGTSKSQLARAKGALKKLLQTKYKKIID